MFQPKNTKDRIVHRLKIAQGHLKKVLSMVENDEYCINVLHQSQAVQNALKETDVVILENHLRTCASDAIKKGNGQKAVDEILSIFKKTQL